MQRFTKRFLTFAVAFLLAIASSPCLAAGIWNGTTTTLVDTRNRSHPGVTCSRN